MFKSYLKPFRILQNKALKAISKSKCCDKVTLFI